MQSAATCFDHIDSAISKLRQKRHRMAKEQTVFVRRHNSCNRRDGLDSLQLILRVFNQARNSTMNAKDFLINCCSQWKTIEGLVHFFPYQFTQFITKTILQINPSSIAIEDEAIAAEYLALVEKRAITIVINPTVDISCFMISTQHKYLLRI